MSWKFWITLSELHRDVEKLQRLQSEAQQSADDKLGVVTDQLAKLSRFVYRTNQDHTSKFDQFGASLTELLEVHAKLDAVSQQWQTAKRDTDSLVDGILHWLDDLDHLRAGLDQSAENPWMRMVDVWTEQLLESLKCVGIHELQVRRLAFDVRTAESVGTVRLDTLIQNQSVEENAMTTYLPYEVVQVVRRGFADADGRILRKATVLTLEMREGYGESTQ